jgi:hypothetical protein
MIGETHVPAWGKSGVRPVTKVGKYTIPFRQLFMCQGCFKGTFTPSYFTGGILEGDPVCERCVSDLRDQLGDEVSQVELGDREISELSEEQKATRAANKLRAKKFADKRRKEKDDKAREQKAQADYRAEQKAAKAAAKAAKPARKKAAAKPKPVKKPVITAAIEGSKTCGDCGSEKDLKEFHVRTYANGSKGHQAVCKECRKAKDSAAWADPTKQATKRANKKAWLAKQAKETV